MAKSTFVSAVAITATLASTLVAACSSKSKSSGSPGPSDSGAPSTETGTPGDGSTGGGPLADADTDANYLTGDLQGCAPLESGCYRLNASSYTPPTVQTTCDAPGNGTTMGAADTHCNGVTPQTVNPASCDVSDAGPQPDSGPPPVAGNCGENGPDYGATMYGNEGDDDDCKYHVTWESTPICEADGVYFIVKANYLTQNSAPLTGACTFAEVCLSNTHPGPNVDSRPPQGSQIVVESPPGTYTIGPVVFDESGDWTVRFHFNEICCDVANDSPHGHAAFHITVP